MLSGDDLDAQTAAIRLEAVLLLVCSISIITITNIVICLIIVCMVGRRLSTSGSCWRGHMWPGRVALYGKAFFNKTCFIVASKGSQGNDGIYVSQRNDGSMGRNGLLYVATGFPTGGIC